MERHLRGALLRYEDPQSPPSVVDFQYNPETLTRSLVQEPVEEPSAPPERRPSPERVTFTLVLDAADLEGDDPTASPLGLLPRLSALELFLDQKLTRLALFVWGSNRVLPVRVASLVIRETEFNKGLAPVRAEVEVVLDVLRPTEERASALAQRIWKGYLAERERLAAGLAKGLPDYIADVLK